jgi:16S rRNA (guanine966-N2)-methyltransferase
VREAVFNALGSAGLIEDALVADLYAGSGAIGIEALSRGAAHCVFVERDRSAINALEANIDALGLDAVSAVRQSAVAAVVGSLDVDIVFADPPYGEVDWSDLLGQIAAPYVVAEDDHEVQPPEGWHAIRARRYGRTWVTFLERRSAATSESSGGELG